MIKLEYWIGDKWVPAGEFHNEWTAWVSLGADNLNYRTVDEDGNVLTDKSLNTLGENPNMETNMEMLEKLRIDRPDQIIHEVISFEVDPEYGFYNVKVDMQIQFLETTIKHFYRTIPYPLSEFEKLTQVQQLDWRWSYN